MKNTDTIRMCEVRMGNHFAYNRDNGNVMRMAPSSMQFSETALNKTYKKVKLTGEIMDKMGFARAGHRDDVPQWPMFTHPDTDHALVVTSYSDDDFDVRFIDEPRHVIKSLYHVHELQNLFHALCGVDIFIREF